MLGQYNITTHGVSNSMLHVCSTSEMQGIVGWAWATFHHIIVNVIISKL